MLENACDTRVVPEKPSNTVSTPFIFSNKRHMRGIIFNFEPAYLMPCVFKLTAKSAMSSNNTLFLYKIINSFL
jgi:hypothetical protein